MGCVAINSSKQIRMLRTSRSDYGYYSSEVDYSVDYSVAIRFHVRFSETPPPTHRRTLISYNPSLPKGEWN